MNNPIQDPTYKALEDYLAVSELTPIQDEVESDVKKRMELLVKAMLDVKYEEEYLHNLAAIMCISRVIFSSRPDLLISMAARIFNGQMLNVEQQEEQYFTNYEQTNRKIPSC